jgi:pimeloyl-ACP methyl ester carboxylesterase
MAAHSPPRKWIRLEGIGTAYLDFGSGEPIVALHGIPTSSLLFAPLLPHLNGIRLIAPDLLGQGKTDTPSGGKLDYAAYAAHVGTFFDTVPPPGFHLLLHDFGGVLGLDWATQHSERVKSIILLLTTLTPSYRITALYAVNLTFGQRLLRWGMRFTLKRHNAPEAEVVEEWVKPWTRRRLLRGGDHFARHHLERIRERVDQIRAPVLLLWGEQDDIFPLSHALRIQQALPQARLDTIPRCGHWSALDAPEEVAQRVVAFLGAGEEPGGEAERQNGGGFR